MVTQFLHLVGSKVTKYKASLMCKSSGRTQTRSPSYHHTHHAPQPTLTLKTLVSRGVTLSSFSYDILSWVWQCRIILTLTLHHSPLTSHPSPLTSHPSPLTTHHSPLILHHSPFTLHLSPFTTHHSPLATHHSPFTPHLSPFIAHHSP